jgi:hypothetical protein
MERLMKALSNDEGGGIGARAMGSCASQACCLSAKPNDNPPTIRMMALTIQRTSPKKAGVSAIKKYNSIFICN